MRKVRSSHIVNHGPDVTLLVIVGKLDVLWRVNTEVVVINAPTQLFIETFFERDPVQGWDITVFKKGAVEVAMSSQ